MDEPKVFDIAKPKPSNGTRPIINPVPTPDPMVKVNVTGGASPKASDQPAGESIKVNVATPQAPVAPAPDNPDLPVQPPEPSEPVAPVNIEPEITTIPVSNMPEPAPEAEAVVQQTEAPSTVSPALPGVSGSSFDNIPKFGELQPKIDAHPLFSGKKDQRVKIRRMPRFAMPLVTLLVLLAVGYTAVDAGAIKGYSHLPFHIFKQKQVAQTPAITTPVATAAIPKNTTPPASIDYTGWSSYTPSNSLGLTFKYPSSWTITEEPATAECSGSVSTSLAAPATELSNAMQVLGLSYKSTSKQTGGSVPASRYDFVITKGGVSKSGCNSGTGLTDFSSSNQTAQSSDRLTAGSLQDGWLTFFGPTANNTSKKGLDTAIITKSQYDGTTKNGSTGIFAIGKNSYQVTLDINNKSSQNSDFQPIDVGQFKGTDLYKDSLKILDSFNAQ